LSDLPLEKDSHIPVRPCRPVAILICLLVIFFLYYTTSIKTLIGNPCFPKFATGRILDKIQRKMKLVSRCHSSVSQPFPFVSHRFYSYHTRFYSYHTFFHSYHTRFHSYHIRFHSYHIRFHLFIVLELTLEDASSKEEGTCKTRRNSKITPRKAYAMCVCMYHQPQSKGATPKYFVSKNVSVNAH